MYREEAMTVENELLKGLYDCFYAPPELSEQEKEVEKCHKALIEALAKPERQLVLRIIDAQDSITELASLDSFIAGFELAWKLSIELQNDEPNPTVLLTRSLRILSLCCWTFLLAFSTIARSSLTFSATFGSHSSSLRSKKSEMSKDKELSWVPSSPRRRSA